MQLAMFSTKSHALILLKLALSGLFRPEHYIAVVLQHMHTHQDSHYFLHIVRVVETENTPASS